MRKLFVAGAHTEIGKTEAACAILRAAVAAGQSVDALKPVVSGFDEGSWADSDPGRLLQAMGRSLSPEELERLSPWRFAAPLAPPSAAALEQRPLRFAPVADFCRDRAAGCAADLLLVEGVGGVMSPITEGALSLDLLEALGCPCVLVGGGYLGSVSHTLTALEVLRGRGREPLAVIVSEDALPDAPSFASTLGMVEAYAGAVPVLAMPRNGDHHWSTRVLDLLALASERS